MVRMTMQAALNGRPLLLAFLIVALLDAAFTRSIDAFAPTPGLVLRTTSPSARRPLDRRSSTNERYGKKSDDDAWDSDADYPDFDADAAALDDDDDFQFLTEKNLGINIGKELGPLSPEEAADIKAQATEAIETAVAGRLAELDDLKKQVSQDFERSKETLRTASELNAQREREKLMSKIDRISDNFLSKNKELREGTKLAAMADRAAGQTGRGVEMGSWGTIGTNVVIVEGGMQGGGSKALGSVDSVLKRSTKAAETKEEEDEEGVSAAPMENRVLIVVDDNQDTSMKKVFDRFTDLLSKAFDSDVVVDRVSPSSSIPLGGNNAQTVILAAPSLNDFRPILSRILQRTTTAGSVGVPPSHVVCVSSLGTERTDKFPYSMQNLLGGKLEKRRDMEEVLVGVVKSRMPGVQAPLDYTIVKWGEITDDGKAKGELSVMPGDSLDGDIGVHAAANVLLQAVAYQPAARNATLSATGGLASTNDVDDASWDDMFLRLAGPELIRLDNLDALSGDDGTLIDKKFERLSEYIKEWSSMFEGEAKGTGLTTPVLIRPSKRPPSQAEGTVARTGVRIMFRTTNTGARYKSKEEERALEREGSTTGSPPASSAPPARRSAKKEGGVEVLVEKTTGNDLRVRARRCNMDDDTVLKEMSEATIVKRLKEGIDVWIKEQLWIKDQE